MITPEELDYIRTAAIRDMLGDSKALDVREHRFDDLMDKIRHWLGECEEMLERRPVSSRTDSELIDHLVPKYEGGFEFGGAFAIGNDEPKFLADEEYETMIGQLKKELNIK